MTHRGKAKRVLRRLAILMTKFPHIIYRVIKNVCRGFNNLSYIIHLRYEYVVTPMDQEILKVFFYDVRCAVVMHFSAWSAVYEGGGKPPLKPSPLTCYKLFGTNSIIVLMFVESQRLHIWSTCKVCYKNLECCSIK